MTAAAHLLTVHCAGNRYTLEQTAETFDDSNSAQFRKNQRS